MAGRIGPGQRVACPYPECAGENPAHARFCATCGRSLRLDTSEAGPQEPETGSSGFALAAFSIAAFLIFFIFSIGGVWRHTPWLMFLPFVIFGIGVRQDRRRRRRWRRWD